MKFWHHLFNIYLALAGVFLASGCASESSSRKEQTIIRLYLEQGRSDRAGAGTVLVTRDRYPYSVGVEPFLTEADLAKVALVKDPGGPMDGAIELFFNEHGSMILDMTTAPHKGRHIIVYSAFFKPGYKPPKEKHKAIDDGGDDMFAPAPMPAPEPSATNQVRQSGWLAAVLIRDRYPNGVFLFTPDASREEVARIVRGLKNVIVANKKRDKY